MIGFEHPDRLDGSSALIPLGFLGAGQQGRIGEVFGPGDLVHRLREMGLRVGAEVQMIRPGRTCIIRLGRQRLGFRADEASGVLVERAGVATAC